MLNNSKEANLLDDYIFSGEMLKVEKYWTALGVVFLNNRRNTHTHTHI